MSDSRPQKGKPTISDVARAAGVSIATVSRVLNKRPDVAENTRLRVQESIEHLGYAAGAQRRQWRSGNLAQIALIIHTADNEYNGTIMQGILDKLDPEAQQLVVHLSNADAEKEARFVHIVQENHCDGLLLVVPQVPEQDLLAQIGHKIPFVLIDHYPQAEDIPCVRATNWQGTREATNYLIELGHRRITFISGRENDRVVHARELGYHSALLEAGITFDPGSIVRGDYSWLSGYKIMRRFIEARLRPTAVMVASDQMAMGAVEAIRVAGLRIPQDISIIGFDDLPTVREMHPSLTTIRQPLYKMGQLATQMLLSLMRKEELVAWQLVMPTHLIVRESTGPAPN